MPFDAVLTAVGGIDMIKSDGGRKNELHATAFEQVCISVRTRAYNHTIRVVYGGGGDIRRLQIHDAGVWFQAALQVGNMCVNYYFHFMRMQFRVQNYEIFVNYARKITKKSVFFTFIALMSIFFCNFAAGKNELMADELIFGMTFAG